MGHKTETPELLKAVMVEEESSLKKQKRRPR
jgi:hypothetical protein